LIFSGAGLALLACTVAGWRMSTLENPGRNSLMNKLALNRKRIDWSHWRRLYIRGDEMTMLEHLSHQSDAPTLGTLKNRSAREDWPALRRDFSDQVMTKTRAIDEQVALEVHRVLGKVRAAHSTLGGALIELAMRGAKLLKPEHLTDAGVARLAQAGAEIQRRALGIQEHVFRVTTQTDLSRLTDAELLELIVTTESELTEFSTPA
jgi:hypothetical protein